VHSSCTVLVGVACLGGIGCCRSQGPSDPAAQYLTDRAFRRAELSASLVNPDNGYSRLRLAAYAVDDGGWDALPEWNPRTESVTPRDLGRLELGAQAAALPIPPRVERDRTKLLALGETAFFRYPVQLAGEGARLLASAEAARRYGFWVDDRGGVGGLVRVGLAGGRTGLAFTCATCHAAERNGTLCIGLGNDALDLGRLSVDAAGEAAKSPRGALLSAWGRGRLDVSSPDGSEPVRIPDLRPVRLQSHLQADATVAQRDLIALAIRLETLIITAHDATIRPPREVSLALAAFVWSLADGLPAPPKADPTARGATVFEMSCAGCHRPPGFTGPPVRIELVGTDPLHGRSPERGTGAYAVPSLRGVADRRLLFHDGAIGSVDALLDPARLKPSFPEGGHRFGLTLGAGDRRALVDYVQRL
jgi:hypothetical protein